EEEFGHLHLTEKDLDRLRQAVLSTLGRNPELDAAGLKTHLVEQGYEGELKQILNDSIYTHAFFARVQKDPFDALGPWREALKAMEAQFSAADIERAKAALMDDLNEETESRF